MPFSNLFSSREYLFKLLIIIILLTNKSHAFNVIVKAYRLFLLTCNKC